jgi:hypothetical protein
VKFKFKAVLIISMLFLTAPMSRSQEMSASAGIGPGNTFTLFITFENPMSNIQRIDCGFQLQGNPKPGQQDFVRQLRCSGAPIKDDDKHYRIHVGELPQDIAEGDYKIAWIDVAVDGQASHRYDSADLPALPVITVKNPKHLEFAPIKKLEAKP